MRDAILIIQMALIKIRLVYFSDHALWGIFAKVVMLPSQGCFGFMDRVSMARHPRFRGVFHPGSARVWQFYHH